MKPPYGTYRWKQVRKRILLRDKHTCQLVMSLKCKTIATIAHHVVDWRDGGHPYAESNLIAACRPCNTAHRNARAATALALEREGYRTTYPAPSRDW